jgi:hypothetical protein
MMSCLTAMDLQELTQSTGLAEARAVLSAEHRNSPVRALTA